MVQKGTKKSIPVRFEKTIFSLTVESDNIESELACGDPPTPPIKSNLTLHYVPKHVCPDMSVTYKCDAGGVNKFLVRYHFYILISK